MSDNEVKIAILQNQMKNIEQKVDDGFKDNKAMFFSLETKITEALNKKADKQEVEELQDNQRWIVRFIIGAVLTALLGLVINQVR